MIGAVPSVTIVEYLVYTRLPLILDDEDVVDARLPSGNRLWIEARYVDPLGKEIELVVPR